MISIITVCLNAEDTITATIESVLNQRFIDYEYIIIDGNSEDRTNEIIEEYRRKFEIKGINYCHISERDSGIYDAMNKGIMLARGEWIGFINADDNYANSEVLTLIDSYISCDSYDCIYGDTICHLEKDFFYKCSHDIETISYCNPFVHQSAFFRIKEIKKYMFDTSYRYAADYNQFVKLYVGGAKFKRIKKPIAFFDLSGASQRNSISAVIEFEKIRVRNGFILKSLVKRYLLYIAVVVIKCNPFLYKKYIRISGKKKW